MLSLPPICKQQRNNSFLAFSVNFSQSCMESAQRQHEEEGHPGRRWRWKECTALKLTFDSMLEYKRIHNMSQTEKKTVVYQSPLNTHQGLQCIGWKTFETFCHEENMWGLCTFLCFLVIFLDFGCESSPFQSHRVQDNVYLCCNRFL